MMMASQRGIPVEDVPYYEVFDATHRRDASNFCNQRATHVAFRKEAFIAKYVDLPRCPTFLTDGCLGVPKDAEYQRMLEASQAENADTPASVKEQNNLFQAAAGGVSKKRRLFGLGSIGKSIASSSGIPRPPPPPPPERFEDTPEFQQAVSRILRQELARLGIAPQQNPEDGSPPHSPKD